MPSQVDPSVIKATVALKRSQTRLTTLRRKCLEETFIERKRHDEIVQTLLTHIRAQALEFPPMLRRALGDAALSRDVIFKVEDLAEKVMDSWMLELSKTEIPWPESLT